MRPAISGEEPFFSHQSITPQLDSTTSKVLSSTRVGPVELIDETFFVELANNAQIDQVFYFESRNFWILQRNTGSRTAASILPVSNA